MPELPEVETVARSLRPRVVGRTIRAAWTSGKKLRVAVDERALREAAIGRRVSSIERLGKYLVVTLEGAGKGRGLSKALLVHLGMSGRLVVAREGEQRAPHTHAVFSLDGAGEELRFVDPRRFGLLLVGDERAIRSGPELALLGPDPLSDAFTVAHLTASLGASRRAVKELLLDQTRIAGLGNIYVCEALFHAGLSPRRRSDGIRGDKVARLHAAIRRVLEAAVAHRGTTFRSYVDGDGQKGGNQLHLAVYGREGEPCQGCGEAVRRIVQGGRSTFYCRRCQT